MKRKKDGKKQHFAAGQAVAETVDTFHRGITGNEPVVLIVFYAEVQVCLSLYIRSAKFGSHWPDTIVT